MSTSFGWENFGWLHVGKTIFVNSISKSLIKTRLIFRYFDLGQTVVSIAGANAFGGLLGVRDVGSRYIRLLLEVEVFKLLVEVKRYVFGVTFSSQKRSLGGRATRLLGEFGLGMTEAEFELGMTEAQLLIFLLFLHLTIRGRRRIDLHFRQDWFSLRKIRLLVFLHLEGALWRSGCTRLSLILSVLTKTNEFIAIVGRDDSCTWFLHNLISKNNLD